MDFLYNNNNTLVNNNTKLLRWSLFLNIHYSEPPGIVYLNRANPCKSVQIRLDFFLEGVGGGEGVGVVSNMLNVPVLSIRQ